MRQPPRSVVFAWPQPVSLAGLQAALPDTRFTFCPLTDPAITEAVAEAEVLICGGPPVSREILAAAGRLQWVQLLGAGVPATLQEPAFLARGIRVTNGRGANVTNLAEHAVAMMFYFACALGEMARRQARREWLHPTLDAPAKFELEGQTLGILGYGAIGKAVAVRARALGMTVLAMRTAAAEPDGVADRIMGLEGLDEILGAVDHLLLCLPSTPQTNGMIGARELALMRPGAHLYNIGRGKVVDTEALIDALGAGRLAGAGLDVVDPEPLPAQSPLWAMPNVLLTGHIAGTTPRFFDRIMLLVEANLLRFARGEPLLNPVEGSGGY